MVVKMFSMAPEKKRREKYKVSVAVNKLEGLLPRQGETAPAAAVEIRWQPSADGRSSGRGGLLSGYLSGRRKRPARDAVTHREAVNDLGVARWAASDWGNRLERVWCPDGDVPEAAPDRSSCSDVVSFSILYGSSNNKGKVNKMEEIGSTIVRVSDWIKESQSKNNGKLQVKELKKELPIETKTAGLSSYALLHITVSLVEETASQGTKGTRTIDDEFAKDSSSQQQNKNCYFDGTATENLPLRQLLQLDKEDNLVNCKSQRGLGVGTGGGSERSSPESGSISRGHFPLWRNRSKIPDITNDFKEETSSTSSPQREARSGSHRDDDPIGTWSEREFISRDKKTMLRVDTFFASIDQRDPIAGGESACAAVAAVIADALHSSGLDAPTRSEFDSLIKEGSAEWRKLCQNASYIEWFPDKHFDIDTVLEAKVRPISVVQDKSFIGFFQPESFKSLHGAMSFDDIWLQITNDIGGDPQVYIVSWNDHFFILKLQASAYFVMDTLGERLYEGCSKAYMLRFDDSTEMYGYQAGDGDEENDELICRGKQCCREYIKRFLAAIPLEEELELEKKETGYNSAALHQRLQIEFQRTELLGSNLTSSRELVDSNRSSSSSSGSNSSWTGIDWKDNVWR